MSLRQFVLIAITLIIGACVGCSQAHVMQPEPGARLPEPPPQAELDQAVVQHSLDSAITLYRVNGDGTATLICSGVRVSPTHIMTAYHCVLAALLPKEVLDLTRVIDPSMRNTEVEGLKGQAIYYTWRGGAEPDTAQVVDYDRAHDIALLRDKSSDAQPFATMRSDRGYVGETIFAVGNPLGYENTFSRGWISYVCREYDDEPENCWTQADITDGPGSSGGGLYDARGYLMGLCSHGPRGIMLSMYADPVAIMQLFEAHAHDE